MNNTLLYIKQNLLVAKDYFAGGVRERMMKEGYEDIDYALERIDAALKLIPLCSDCGADLYDKHQYCIRDSKLCIECYERFKDSKTLTDMEKFEPFSSTNLAKMVGIKPKENHE